MALAAAATTAVLADAKDLDDPQKVVDALYHPDGGLDIGAARAVLEDLLDGPDEVAARRRLAALRIRDVPGLLATVAGLAACTGLVVHLLAATGPHDGPQVLLELERMLRHGPF
ncbi:hypothetical protein BIV57_00725 [Mangrovactinospora gilvigrisea]|uniref:Uncharacterized protein n=1 Tax=Mangrovactinospora gilvigrisea TaxID=1428644 RepID=A0A1J7BL34_9ACTN|nr:hypothetical protein [Mangrovactinospora gilvigrisea]OIV39399.1 hypothetical protein BIV57_00725 [Mangrovactinospora gilvigrisea]